MKVDSLATVNAAAQVDFEKYARDPSVSEQDKVKAVAREFESFLVKVYVTEARKPQVTSKFNLGSEGHPIHQDMINTQLADSISRNGHLGLAKVLEQQLQHHVDRLNPRAEAAGAESAAVNLHGSIKR